MIRGEEGRGRLRDGQHPARILAVAVAMLVIAGCGGTSKSSTQAAPTTSTAADTGKPDLSRLVLRGSQVGPGYRLQKRPDGHGVDGFVTLDLCGFAFHSEALRVDRLQVDYGRGKNNAMSNEVVTYLPGGARTAMREFAKAIRQCPTRPVGSHIANVPKSTYRLRRITTHGLLPGSIAVAEKASAIVKGRRVSATTVVVYQVDGDTLSGIYVYAPHKLAAHERMALKVAAESAANLRRAARDEQSAAGLNSE